jgi:pimeloyl-ACP methyl ester carboxylesterase/DNA-binding CsgD family transcriptional regulator
MNTNEIETGKSVSPEIRDDVIEHLYEVAMDPLRYEDLLDRWESMIKPIRKGANGTLVNSDLNAEFAAHFTRAAKFLEHLEDADSPPGRLDQIYKTAAFLVNRNLGFVEVNDAAKTLFSINRESALSDLPIDKNDLPKLEAEISRVIRSNTSNPVVYRVENSGTGRSIVFQFQKICPDDGPPVVVAITSEINWPTEFDALLKSAFDLTATEAGIMRALAESQSLREIAASRDRSVETVRAQLRSVLSKTETHTQAELVRLTFSMMDIASYTMDAATRIETRSTGFETLETRPFRQVTLRDGRIMEYLVLGDPAGRPVVFLPQDYGLVRWPASAEAKARRDGIRVISIVRAGYGNSSPLPKKAHVGNTVAGDIADLLTDLGIEECPFLTLGPDSYHAFRFHDNFPNRVSAIIACAGTFPLENAEQYERMHKWHRFILAGARYTPHLLPFMVKAGFLLARKLGKRGFIHAIFGESDADVATFENSEVFEAIVCGSEVCLSDTFTAHKMFSAEVIDQEGSNWGHLIHAASAAIPVHYINGEHDPQVPIETLREMQQQYSDIRYTVYDDGGQLIFFLKWNDVLGVLENYL